MSRFRIAVFAIVLLCLAALSHAQPADRPLANWSAPSSWTPAAVGHAATSSAKTRSATTQGDLTNPLPFIAVTPCRLIDTRHGPLDIPASPARGTYTTGETRTYDFSKSTTCTGLPTSAGAWSLMFQYTTSAVSGGPASFLTAWPAGTTMPSPESTLLGYADRWSANSAIIPGGGTDSSISVYAQHGGDVIIDINGYYSESPASGEGFNLYTNTAGYAISAVNNDTVCLGFAASLERAIAPNQMPLRSGGKSTAPRWTAPGSTARTTPESSPRPRTGTAPGCAAKVRTALSASRARPSASASWGKAKTPAGIAVLWRAGNGTSGVTGIATVPPTAPPGCSADAGEFVAEGLPTYVPAGVLGEAW